MVQPEDREDGATVDIILKGKRQMKRKYGVVDYLRKHYPPPEGSGEEFKARLKEGQAFRLKEKAVFHVISIDENRPPLVQMVGDSELIAQMLAFAISEIIESSVKNGVPREQAEGMFRIALELGIATSRN